MIYINNTFTGHYPVGTSAVVCASSQAEAAQILQKALNERGLDQRHPIMAKDMIKFMAVPGNCMVINDGDY